MPRPLLLALPLALAAVLLLAPRLADALALRIAARLQPLAQLASTSPRLEAEPESDPQPAQVADSTDAASAPSTKARAPGKASRSETPAKARVLSVSAETVLKLAESGARPRGRAVAATPKRPPGLRLSGVSALGIGVRDGDVLTQAAGVSALDASSVIEAILAARARGALAVSGTFYRGDERWAIVVHQPYLERAGSVP